MDCPSTQQPAACRDVAEVHTVSSAQMDADRLESSLHAGPAAPRELPPTCNPVELYKRWVRKHPKVVNNLDWLVYLALWSPLRTSSSTDDSSSSEASYEAFNAAIGLLSVWHQHILDEVDPALPKRPGAALFLDALEQVSSRMLYVPCSVW